MLIAIDPLTTNEVKAMPRLNNAAMKWNVSCSAVETPVVFSLRAADSWCSVSSCDTLFSRRNMGQGIGTIGIGIGTIGIGTIGISVIVRRYATCMQEAAARRTARDNMVRVQAQRRKRAARGCCRCFLLFQGLCGPCCASFNPTSTSARCVVSGEKGARLPSNWGREPRYSKCTSVRRTGAPTLQRNVRILAPTLQRTSRRAYRTDTRVL